MHLLEKTTTNTLLYLAAINNSNMINSVIILENKNNVITENKPSLLNIIWILVLEMFSFSIYGILHYTNISVKI